ncbi:MAG: MBL fold metallo-hydrolase [Haloarculaceae archaeon]
MIHNLARGQQGFTSNVFLVTGERPVLVDAGNDFDVVSAVRERVTDLSAVVLTHTHPDHVGNLEAVRAAFDAPVYGFDPDYPGVDRELADGDEIALGDDDYRAIHTPGHKDDHLCLYSAAADVLFAGDLVFANGGFGRTDLEEGDRAALIESIERVLETTGDIAAFHAGHGPSVTNDARTEVELALQAARF